jgi:uncharacterized protein (TIGR03790 family)
MGKGLLSSIASCVFTASAALAQQPLNQRVLVVYNSLYSDSLEVAQYYAAQRGVPAANLCPISNFDTRDVLTYAPVRDAIRACLNTVGPSNILYVVMSYLTPWQVWPLWPQAPVYMLDSYIADIWDKYSTQNFLVVPTGTHGYYADAQAAGNYYPPFLPFASYRADPKATLIYSVFRLDAPTKELAKALVDRAIAAEALPARTGQGCFDMRLGDPNVSLDQGYYAGDWDIYRASLFTAQAGLPVTTDQLITEFGTAPSPLTCPNALLYMGWYSLNNYNNAFTWNPGAIGWHLDSNAALSPRGGTSWVPNAIQNGITISFGAAEEPYLEGIPRGGLIRNLLEGANAGDAALRNTRWIRWRMMNFGDPLYRPFPGGLAPFNAPLFENYLKLGKRFVVGGKPVSATVQLANIAPPGGTTVNLSSSHSGIVGVPASVTVAQGARTATFSVTIQPVTSQQNVLITGSAPGVSMRNDAAVFPLLAEVAFAQSSIPGGNAVQAAAVLNDLAPLGGAVINLATDTPGAAAVPASVTVPAGNSRVLFSITTFAVGSSTPVKITATYAGASVDNTLIVTP